MALTSEKKKAHFTKFGGNEKNTGNSEAQIAMFTDRINELTGHLKIQPKDFSTQQSLIKLVGKRKSLLSYLHNTKIDRYRKIISELGLRK